MGDPETLDFAPHVRHHALVAVLQRGLLYHEAERESAQVRDGESPAVSSSQWRVSNYLFTLAVTLWCRRTT